MLINIGLRLLLGMEVDEVRHSLDRRIEDVAEVFSLEREFDPLFA
ncbi:MAG: hypothetical protein ACR2KU_02495 [Gammaproteobacteria bacterium]